MPIALEFFVHYAYSILFLWVLVEQLGVPIPSAPMLLTAGTLSATHRVSAGYSMIAIVIACGIADSIWYFAGVRYGHRVVALVCRLSLEASTCVKKTEGYFTRYGSFTLLFAKFVPGFSALAPPIAGQTSMPYLQFLLWDLAGSVIWGGTFVFGGRFFGDLIKRSSTFFHLMARFGVVLFVALVLGIIIVRIVRQRRFLLSVRSMRIGPDELKHMIDEPITPDCTPFIVDLRHPLDYLPDPRVLPGALRIGPKELEKRAGLLPRDRDVILYCTCPSEETSAALAQRLHKMGIYRVRPLKGGFDGWKDAGYPLEEYNENDPRLAIVGNS